MNNLIFLDKIHEQGALLSVREAAEFLDVTPQTLYLWRNKECNVLPFVRMGRHYKYLLSDLKKFIESKRKS